MKTMNYVKRLVLVVAIAALGVSAIAAKWDSEYMKGLAAAKRGDWVAARQAFLEAISARADDTAKASQVGTSLAERKPWRDGAPYSPNFAAAYCAFKMAANSGNTEERKELLAKAIGEFRALIEKGQESAESLLFLAAALNADNRAQEAAPVQERLARLDVAKAFKVDREVIEFDDLRILGGILRGTGDVDTAPISLPGADNPFGIVPALDHKYALLIGVSDRGFTFADADVDLLKDSLVKHAGYAEHRVTTLKNPSHAEFSAAVKALAEALPDGGTVFIYFTGPARQDANGRDEVGLTGGTWISKHDLYSSFVPKGANIFAFFQVDRKIGSEGRVFGSDLPQVGKIAQSMGAAPGELCNQVAHEGAMHGAYTVGIAQVLAKMRNNRIAIGEFVWAVFDAVRKGTGGGAQTPTLPIYIGMTSTSRF